MPAGAIIVLHPAREDAAAIRRGVVRSPVRPLAQRGLDETLHAPHERPRAPLPHRQRLGLSVPQLSKPAQGAPQKAAGGRLAFVREQVHVRHARMIVDGDGRVFASGAAELVEALPRHAVPQTANPAQLLGIEVQQITAACS